LRKDGLSGLYYRLTPEERFRLVIEAEARGDEEESRRLVQSAPQYTYTGTDPAYTDRIRATQQVTMLMCLDLAPCLAEVHSIGCFREALPMTHIACINEAHFAYLDGREAGLKEGWRAAGMKGEPPNADKEGKDSEIEEALERMTQTLEGASERFLDLLEKLKLEVVGEAGALWEAFSIFSCEELGLEPKKLVKMWFEPALFDIEELEMLTEGMELDREKVEEYETLLKRCWSKLIGSI